MLVSSSTITMTGRSCMGTVACNPQAAVIASRHRRLADPSTLEPWVLFVRSQSVTNRDEAVSYGHGFDDEEAQDPDRQEFDEPETELLTLAVAQIGAFGESLREGS